jgi:membrane protease YdiL (CAAX protease family)
MPTWTTPSFLFVWIPIFLASEILLFSQQKRSGALFLAVGYFAAFTQGMLDVQALLPLALLCLAGYLMRSQRFTLTIGHVLFSALAVALFLHALPGFHNVLIVKETHMTPDAEPFTLYLNLDKPLAGLLPLLLIPWIHGRSLRGTLLVTSVVGTAATASICLTAALLLGMVAWEPKWPGIAGIWMVNNLLLVAMAEEVFFRGYLQGGMSRLFRRLPHGSSAACEVLALCTIAALFGLAHLSGGWRWAVLASLAGLGYGLAYRHGGLRASVLVHFGVNTVHFLLFTYLMLQAPSHQ